MTITPFLPGLPTPAAPDGGTPGEVPAGDIGAAFGEALAAALAGSLVVPALPTAPMVEVGGAPAPALVPVVEVRSAQASALLPAVEVRGASAPSLETPGPDAPAVPSTVPAPRPEVSRLVAGAPRTSTTGEVVGGAPRTSTTEEEPEASGLVAGAPDTSPPEKSDPTQPPPPSPVLPGLPGLPGLSALGPTATAAPVVDLTPEAVGKAVVQQVFPEVTHLASTAGNGTHRITLTLQPEQLGEVRVTLVVRDGSVHVRLAGGAGIDGVDGAAVHRALSGGAPELQRLLERTGAEARVSVRDPFAATLPTVTGSASSTAPQPVLPTASGQPGFQTGPDAQSRSDPQARHDGQSAREQSPRDQPRQESRRPAYSVEPVPVPATGRLDRTV